MGLFDRNNYLAVIKVRDNITDPEYLDYCIRTDMDFSIEEYDEFEREHPMPTHPVPLKALDFICTYKDGKMKPDRWGGGDPLKKNFDDDTPRLLVSILTQPGQGQSIKKRRCYYADFMNEWYCPIWEKEGKFWKPQRLSMKKRVLPDYMFTMTFYFSKSLKNIYPFIEEFVKDFCNALPTDYGKIIDQSTMETIFDVSEQQSV